MNKKYFVIGVVLLLMGLLFSYASGQQLLSNLANPNNTLTSYFSLGVNDTVYINATANTWSFFSFVYNSTRRLNFYLVNQSAFRELTPYFNSTANLSRASHSLSGKGVIEISENSASAAFPYQQNYAQYIQKPNYTESNASMGAYFSLPAGTYSMIFRNPGPENSSIVYSYYVKSSSSASLTGSSSFGFGMVSGILLIIGFALAVFSLFKGQKSGEQKLKPEELQRTYDEIESEARTATPRGMRPGRKKPKSGKTGRRRGS